MGLRLFVAVAVPEPAGAALHGALQAARAASLEPRGLRWLSPDGYHFTLQFLGSVEPERVRELSNACARAAARVAPFRLELGGPGAFGSARRARVLWVGVEQGADAMTRLAAAVHAQTAELGFEVDARPYTPHLTVARIKRPANVTALLDALPSTTLAMDVRELVLFRSHLSHEGARYEALHRAPLTGPVDGGAGADVASDAQ
jgi:2'-5' RNA ligase